MAGDVPLRERDDRRSTRSEELAPEIYIVTDDEIDTLQEEGWMNTAEIGIYGTFAGVQCGKCGLLHLLELDAQGSEAHERQMGAEVYLYFGNTYYCGRCDAEIGCDFQFIEYPPLISTVFNIEGSDKGIPTPIPGMPAFIEAIKKAKPYSWKLRRNLEESHDWLAAVGGMAPSLVAGIKALTAAMERSIAIFGSFKDEERETLAEIQQHLISLDREGVIVDEITRITGDAVRNKSARVAHLCRGIIIFDHVASGHLSEFEMFRNERPIAILQAGEHLTTAMLDGTQGDFVKVFKVNNDLESAVDLAVAWIDEAIQERDKQVEHFDG